MITYSIIVSGEVHGVFYRQTTLEKATDLGITGHVKNLPDNKVEVIATGPKEQLDLLVEWCRQGPSRARVANVEVKQVPLRDFSRFTIVRY